MRTFAPVAPPRDMDPRVYKVLRRQNDFLAQVGTAFKRIEVGQTPDQGGNPPPTTPGVTDHGDLTGLVPVVNSSGGVIDYNDDHTQYALLQGRTAGQYLYGSRYTTAGQTWDTRGTFALAADDTDQASWAGIATAADAPVGTGIFVVLATRNSSTTTGVTNYHTAFADSAGNTWTKLKEYSLVQTGLISSSSLTVSVWFSLVTTAITGGTTTLSATYSGSQLWSALEAYSFNLAAGVTVTVVDSAVGGDGAGIVDGQLASQSLTATGDTLYLRAISIDAYSGAYDNTLFTPTGGFTAFTSNHTNSTIATGVSDLGSSARGEFRVLSQGVTSQPTIAAIEIYYDASILLALQLTPGTPGLLNLASVNATQAANIELSGSVITENSTFFNFQAAGGTTTLSYISGTDGSFNGPVNASSITISPAVHLLNTDMFDDVVAGTAARGDLIVGNSTPAWTKLGISGTTLRQVVLIGNGTDVSWTNAPALTNLSVRPSTALENAITVHPYTGGEPFYISTYDGIGAILTYNLSLNVYASTTPALVIDNTPQITTFPTMAVNLAMGGNDITGLDDVTLNADGASYIGTSAVGLAQAHFALATANASGPRTDWRGIIFADDTYGDSLIGSDPALPSYFTQRTVKAGSTATDYSETATAFSQGAWGTGSTPVWPFIEMNPGVGDGSTGGYAALSGDGVTYIRDGAVTAGWYNATGTLGGGGVVIGARTQNAATYLNHDEANKRFLIRGLSGPMAAQYITSIGIGGSQVVDFVPLANNTIDHGTSSLKWKDGYYAGAVNVAGSANLAGAITHTGTTVGLYSATPVAQASAMTTQLTTLTFTAPGTPDYAIADLVDSGSGSAFGFSTKDEGNTVLSVIANLQARVQQLENMLSTAAGGIGVCA